MIMAERAAEHLGGAPALGQADARFALMLFGFAAMRSAIVSKPIGLKSQASIPTST